MSSIMRRRNGLFASSVMGMLLSRVRLQTPHLQDRTFPSATAACRSTLPRERFSPLSSGPEDFHLRALPEPYVNLSIHTAPIVRPLPWHSDQWARSLGFARRSRSNQSLAPLV